MIRLKYMLVFDIMYVGAGTESAITLVPNCKAHVMIMAHEQ
jgi:hypothetical protein